MSIASAIRLDSEAIADCGDLAHVDRGGMLCYGEKSFAPLQHRPSCMYMYMYVYIMHVYVYVDIHTSGMYVQDTVFVIQHRYVL